MWRTPRRRDGLPKKMQKVLLKQVFPNDPEKDSTKDEVDMVAFHVLPALIQRETTGHIKGEEFAQQAYDFAEAFIKEKNKRADSK